MSKRKLLPVGIDDMAFFVPKLYLPIRVLAEKRQIHTEKLEKGLGLINMAVPDVHEDAATMAAEVIYEIIGRNQLDPRQIGRIYLGTESAIDMSKPTATYAVGMVEQRLAGQYGQNCFQHCDVLDMTFACSGAVDALQNCLDWVATDPDHLAIVVASDLAKYELHSSGEYTQGAGAVAVLIKWKPRLLAFRSIFGVGMRSVHDFFKPRRERFVETPIFDGQFSNQCYRDRMMEALADFRRKSIDAGVFAAHQYCGISDRWARLIFHLPYAYHGKRIYIEQFIAERKSKGLWANDVKQWQLPDLDSSPAENMAEQQKATALLHKKVSESSEYQSFVKKKIEKSQRASSQVGNLYTASIFLALMSTLEIDAAENAALVGKRIGFIAYGSGSKSKVFEAVVQPQWQQVAGNFGVFEKLSNRQTIDYEQYIALHTHRLQQSIGKRTGKFALTKIGTDGALLGARFYEVGS